MLKILSELLVHGYSIHDSLLLLDEKGESLVEKLEKGMDIEYVIIPCLHKKIQSHFEFFIQILPMSKAIDSSINLIKFQNSLKQMIIKQSIYPCILIILSFILIYFFSSMILPMMMETYDSMPSVVMIGMEILKWFTRIVLVMVIMILLIWMLIWFNSRLRLYIYVYLNARVEILKKYSSYIFASYYYQFSLAGISTYDMFMHLHQNPKVWLRQYAQDIIKQLETGNDYVLILEKSSWMDQKLVKMIKVGSALSCVDDQLNLYIDQTKKYFERVVKQFTIGISGCTYVLIAILVLLVFQIMLIPLSMIESM